MQCSADIFLTNELPRSISAFILWKPEPCILLFPYIGPQSSTCILYLLFIGVLENKTLYVFMLKKYISLWAANRYISTYLIFVLQWARVSNICLPFKLGWLITCHNNLQIIRIFHQQIFRHPVFIIRKWKSFWSWRNWQEVKRPSPEQPWPVRHSSRTTVNSPNSCCRV